MADQGQGMLPPSTAPTPQNVRPSGNEALGNQLMRNITGALHYARMFFPPGSEQEKAISHHFKGLSKIFPPDASTMKGGQMPPVSQVAGAPGAAGGGAPPPLGGMGGTVGAPPTPPRGPIPMAPAGGRGGPGP